MPRKIKSESISQFVQKFDLSKTIITQTAFSMVQNESACP